MSVIVSIVIGYVLDMIIGTPKGLKKIKSIFIKFLRKLYKKINGKLGIILTVLILAAGGVLFYGITMVLKNFNMIYAIIFESIICYFCISCKDIKVTGERVHKALKRGYIKRATKLFNTLTDNGEINEPREIAENIIIMIVDESLDRVIAPVFYIIVFGGAGGVVYKLLTCINDASDSLFPRVLRNIADLIPARIAVLFMFVAGKTLKMNCKNAFKIFKRDRYKLKSLNRGLLMSVCAGALGIELNFRKSDVKIGDKKKITAHNDIKRTFEMINITSLLTLVVLAVIRILIVIFIV